MRLSPPIEKTETYEPGEEVVVRLDSVKDLQPEAPAAGLPPWTIAEVLARREHEHGVVYEVRFVVRRRLYVCEVDAASIEGTA